MVRFSDRFDSFEHFASNKEINTQNYEHTGQKQAG